MGLGTVQAKIIAALIIAVTAFGTGWAVKGWKVSSDNEKAEKAVKKEVKKIDKTNRDLVKETQVKDEESRVEYQYIIKEVPKQTDGTECFGAGAARVWNDAFAAIRSIPEDPTGTSGTGGGADSSGEVKFTDEEILRNQVQNAELWKKHRDRLNAIIEWDERQFGAREGKD